MDASYKIQRGIHVHLIQFFMCPEFWVHIIFAPRPFLLFSFIIYHSAAPPFPPRPASFCQKSLAIRRKGLYNKCVKHVD